MAKATLEFDLNDPDDAMSHKRAVHATDAYLSLYDFSQYLFRIGMHEELSVEQESLVEAIQNHFYEDLEIHGINLDRDIS